MQVLPYAILAYDFTSNIPRNIHRNLLKNNTFNCNYFPLENKTMVGWPKKMCTHENFNCDFD